MKNQKFKVLNEIFKYKIIKNLTLIVLGLITLIIAVSVIWIIVSGDFFNVLIILLSSLTALTGSIIALLIPSIMKYIDDDKKRQNTHILLIKCFEILRNFIKLSFEEFDVRRNTKLLTILEFFNTYKKEFLVLDLFYFEREFTLRKNGAADETYIQKYIYFEDLEVRAKIEKEGLEVEDIDIFLADNRVQSESELFSIYSNLAQKIKELSGR